MRQDQRASEAHVELCCHARAMPTQRCQDSEGHKPPRSPIVRPEGTSVASKNKVEWREFMAVERMAPNLIGLICTCWSELICSRRLFSGEFLLNEPWADTGLAPEGREQLSASHASSKECKVDLRGGGARRNSVNQHTSSSSPSSIASCAAAGASADSADVSDAASGKTGGAIQTPGDF